MSIWHDFVDWIKSKTLCKFDKHNYIYYYSYVNGEDCSKKKAYLCSWCNKEKVERVEKENN